MDARMPWAQDALERPTYSALIEVFYGAASTLDLTALCFVLEPTLLRRARRFRRAPHLRFDPRFLDHRGQAFHRVAPVVFLRAMALCRDDDHVLVREASTCKRAQPLSYTLRQCRPGIEVAAQLHGARNLVDVLTARSARADEAQLDRALGDVRHRVRSDCARPCARRRSRAERPESGCRSPGTAARSRGSRPSARCSRLPADRRSRNAAPGRSR